MVEAIAINISHHSSLKFMCRLVSGRVVSARFSILTRRRYAICVARAKTFSSTLTRAASRLRQQRVSEIRQNIGNFELVLKRMNKFLVAKSFLNEHIMSCYVLAKACE